MIDLVSSLSSEQILAIPVTEPEILFGRPDLISPRYKDLARRWHPDLPSGNADVFTHIVILHDAAKKLTVWRTPGEFSFVTTDHKQYMLRYFKSFDFELGSAYLSDTRITYVIRNEFDDLAENAKRMISGLKFPDKPTEDVMRRYLPTIVGSFKTADSTIIMIDKPADLIRMRDLVNHLGGRIDAKHVAWMVSRMLNHTSYFEVAGISHNDFSMDTLFVCPEQHTVCVLGGWWYASAIGEKLKALPQRTINNAPADFLKAKLAKVSVDAELVRVTGRELLGNTNGIHLVNDPNIPAPMVNWLRLTGMGSPIQDYQEWRDKILISSFGKRKFIKLPVTTSEVYQPV